MSALLEVEGLSVTFRGVQTVHAVSDVSFALGEAEILALVGESGCGKSVIAHAVAGLLPPSAEISGSIHFQGRDLLSLPEEEMVGVRGDRIGIILQNPSLALNPLHTVGRQVAEPLRVHRGEGKERALEGAARALLRLGFADPEGTAALYPSMCSGGMNQRVVTAASTVLDPPLLIADEPTKGLDRERVEEIAGFIGGIAREGGAALLLITHDLRVARSVADRVAVCYAGEIVEVGPASSVLSAPHHPYTRGLLGSTPEGGFVPIPGSSPSPISPPHGCRFHPRCPRRTDRCTRAHPASVRIGYHEVRCLRCP